MLAVDFDPQFALTRRFGVSPAGRPTICDVFRDGREVESVIAGEVAAGVDLLPSSRGLSSIELSLVGERKREYFLARALADVVEGAVGPDATRCPACRPLGRGGSGLVEDRPARSLGD